MKKYNKTLYIRNGVLDEICARNGNCFLKQDFVVGKLIIRIIWCENGWATELDDYQSSGQDREKYILAL